MTLISIFNGRHRALGNPNEAEQRIFIQIDVRFLEILHMFQGAPLSVLMALALRANENGWAWPSVETLMRDTGLSRNSVFRALDYLCAQRVNGQRVLLRARVRNPSGTLGTNCYLLFPTLAEEKEYDNAELAEYPDGVSPARYQKLTLCGYGGEPGTQNWYLASQSCEPRTTFTNVVKLHPNNNHDSLNNNHDDDDDDKRAEINKTNLEKILRAVWEGTVGRPASPEEMAELEALLEFCPPTKLLALIPNLALRVGPQNLTLSLLRAAATGELSIAGLDAAMPVPSSIPEPAPVPPAPPSASERWGGDPVLAEVVAMYEQEIGPITQMVAEELKAMTEEVRDLARWREAFRAAVAANVRRWSYVRACLRGDGRGKVSVAPVPAPARGRAVRARVVRPEDMPPMPDEEPLPPPD